MSSVVHQLVAGPLIVDDTLARAGGPPVAVRGPLIARLGGQDSFSPSDPGLIQTGSCPGGLGADPLADPPVYPLNVYSDSIPEVEAAEAARVVGVILRAPVAEGGPRNAEAGN